MQVEAGRSVGDRMQRRVAEHADGQHSSFAGNTGQRRGFVRRHLAGAARNEDEASERRWPGGAHVSAAIQPAQFDASEHELARRLGRVGRAHQRRADEKGVNSGREPFDVGPRRNAGFGDEQAIGRQSCEPLRGREVDRQILKVAVVDADQRCAERQCAPHLRLVVDFHQRIHAETAGFGDHRSRFAIVEQRQHHEDCVGPGDPRFDDLARVDEEVLGEDRPVELAPSGREIVERAAEICAVAQHAERIGDSGISARQSGRIGARADRALRGRRLLDFEDEARAGLSERLGEAAVRRPRASAQRVERNAVEPARKLLALRRRNLAEDPGASATARLDEPLERVRSATGLQGFAREHRAFAQSVRPCPPSSAKRRC